MRYGALGLGNIRYLAKNEEQSKIQGGFPIFDRSIARLIDILVSVMALIFLAPLMLLVAMIVFLADPGPVIFGHRRVGRNGSSFKCLKFRSMVTNADVRLADLLANDHNARVEWASTHKLRNDPRITSVGRFLRKSSIDELPQLFNVLLGHMSLVGPRPIVAAEIEKYGRYYGHYCSVRPGITGLWQISGRNDISYRRRVAADVAYARTKTWLFDVKILILTIPHVLLARGSY
jgi:lipopolysaccharide/colanic/teichoic acid biosynthesis glycosyltransferase